MKILLFLFAFSLSFGTPYILSGQNSIEQNPSSFFKFDSGSLVYTHDEKGNRLPDFSFVGYHSGEKPLPNVAVQMTLNPIVGDNTLQIQEALDQVAKLPLDDNGHRGALLLKKGVYNIAGTISIKQSGIVLKGEGDDENGTVLVATGYGDQKYKRNFFEVGTTDKIKLDASSFQEITDNYVPIGTHSFSIKSIEKYKVGDRIVVYRPSTKSWITAIGCDTIAPRWAEIRNIDWVQNTNNKKSGFYYKRVGYDTPYSILQKKDETWEDFQSRIPLSDDGKSFDFTKQWEPGDYDLYFERKITNIQGDKITIDAPIVHAMESEFGGGGIYHFTTLNRIGEVGIENLRLISEFGEPTKDNPYGSSKEQTTSEQHAWNGIVLNENTENTWIRNVTGNYFGWSLISAKGKKATIQDCVNLGHASEITGGRRYPFMINGQLNLVQRCVTFEGRHEFVNQEKTLGPNVFVDCIGFQSKSNAGPHHRYAVGNLYDNITSEKPMESRYRGNSGTGHGWAGTQTCFYNCVAPEFLVEAPLSGISWVIGSSDNSYKKVHPKSLYYQQVQDRLGSEVLKYLVSEEQLNAMGSYPWLKDRLHKEDAKFQRLFP